MLSKYCLNKIIYCKKMKMLLIIILIWEGEGCSADIEFQNEQWALYTISVDI